MWESLKSFHIFVKGVYKNINHKPSKSKVSSVTRNIVYESFTNTPASKTILKPFLRHLVVNSVSKAMAGESDQTYCLSQDSG